MGYELRGSGYGLQVKLGHRFSQIPTDILFLLAFYILVFRVHPCPQKGNSYPFELRVAGYGSYKWRQFFFHSLEMVALNFHPIFIPLSQLFGVIYWD